MQHQTGKWTQESHPHSLNLGWTHWSLEQDLALEGHGPGQFRAREDSYLSVEQGPPSPTFPSTQYLKPAPNTGSGYGSRSGEG